VPAAKSRSSRRNAPAKTAPAKTTGHAGKPAAATAAAAAAARASFAEDLINRILRPLDLVLLTRERIQATLDEAAERGRVTRTDANDLVSELVKRGRQQTDDLLADLEGRVGRSREQLEAATRRVESATHRARRAPPVDRLVRGADRARRSVVVGGGVSSEFPISDYDELTVAQVMTQLPGLAPAQLRKVRDHERSHANRKSVLAAVEKLLG
jgi:polyhydroxyalkanoate synthesis regulator phasin